MATFVHIADERLTSRILRGGIRATEFEARARDTAAPRRGVFCVPVVANFQMTFQWLRELKRRGHRLARGIQFRIDDTEAVFIGHYNQVPQEMTAAQSIAFFLQAEDPRGLQVVVPRAIAAREITGIRSIPQVAGWRFYPAAKGRPPLWPIAGETNASRLRRRIEQVNKDP
ncbi:hypothetical protein [Bradyrhizobium sp. McL0615]|uniref:hypothetical protein n=1 Tax=Bradyrhizobium sp. McL0615 TaxID=3415673 RepID=UPI003CF1B168